jgi:AcrR family transcriptional regulator
MTRVPAEPDEADPVITPSVTRIRAAALHLFAEHGTEATPLRAVAAAAGVSLGLVQHHFGTKAGLVNAVDKEVLRVLTAMMTEPIPEPPADPVAEVGQRVSSLIAEQPDVVNYLSRAFVTGGALGTMIFDALAANGAARWNELHDHEQTRPDLDLQWAPLHPLILVVGTLILRPHLDRHLAEPFGTPRQLQRWQTSVNALLSEGQLRRTTRVSRDHPPPSQ